VDATHIPENVTVSVEGAEAGTRLLAADIELPEGASLITDAGAIVVNVSQARTAEDVEAELAEAEAELGIEHDVSEEEAEAEEAAEGGEGEAATAEPAAEGDAEKE